MFFSILTFIFLGILFGVFTGIIPGIHPNTIFIIVLSGTFILNLAEPLFMMVFMVALAVSNTFTDFVPSIFLGAPEPSTALSVLPGHRMLLSGRGYDALYLTVVGGLGVTLLTLISLPLFLSFIPNLYISIKPYIHIILIIIVLWMIFTEKGTKLHATLVFILSGIMGILTLNTLPSSKVLFPALTGLFALSTLLISTNTAGPIPSQQTPKNIHIKTKPILAGWLAGILAAMLPGTGSAQTGTITSQVFRSDIRDFITSLGGINTSNIIFTIIIFYTLGKTRSGLVVSLSRIIHNLTPFHILIVCATISFTAFVSSILTLKIGSFVITTINRIDYSLLNKIVIISLLLIITLLSGLLGLCISFISTLIGIFCITSGTRRTHLMGFLLLPTIVYYIL